MSRLNTYCCSTDSQIEHLQLFLDSLISDKKFLPNLHIEVEKKLKIEYEIKSKPLSYSVPASLRAASELAISKLETVVGNNRVSKGKEAINLTLNI